jgi:formate dehydrogenase major subunit
MEELNIVLNGKNITGRVRETVLQLAGRHGIKIPTLCHDPRLLPFSSCYVCVVEIEGMRGMQPSCSTLLTEGMIIRTDNEKIRKARKTALDLLVSNHYADCVAPCMQACPAGVDIQGYISLIDKGLYSEAVALIKEVNPLPAVCGRVCVRPCEVACRRNLMNEGHAVGIDYLKRFASDHDLVSPERYVPEIAGSTGKKVAIIGAGPGGLSAAWFLQLKGHQCDIFEANPHAGGWLRYGIPEYRLPNDILQKEVDAVTELGVNIFYNRKFGADLNYKEIKAGYDALILTIGSQRGTLLGCRGEDARGVFSGIDFLRNMEMTGQRYNFKGKKVAVVGGGNTAMDCCRTSLRCGAEKVYIIYRRTEKEMPANPIEIHESKIEGAEYMFLTNPIRINKNDDGSLFSVTCIKMKPGEPDDSGRRRPVPVENSEFDIELDYILAAIGQRTDVEFLDDINCCSDNGKLEVNKWGDIVASRETMQTGIPSVFAAGDGVSGPATIIEAIAQARIASASCHQYLSGEEPAPEKPGFISRKENFREFTSELLVDRYKKQARQEMPVLEPEERSNFNEVELGYESQEVAMKEASRCLECGCSEIFTCDLKSLSTEYNATQSRYGGDFQSHETDHTHPYIEIDNNKCILCARCVRICREIAGAGALGLVNRGFDTYVAPSLGDSLLDTECESCGLCISTCPTGAITENVPFKPAPVKWDTFDMICNYCSAGCKINIHHKGGFVLRVTGAQGQINKDGNICRYAKFGYHYLNDKSRVTTPLLRINGEFKEVSFAKALEVILGKAAGCEPGENAFYGGARLSNEELYLVQKLARAGFGSGNVNSFHYLLQERSPEYNAIPFNSFTELESASIIYILGAEINTDIPLPGFIINRLHYVNGIPVELITCREASSMENKVDTVRRVSSYYHLIKAMNHYYLSRGVENEQSIREIHSGFDDYKNDLLKEDFNSLLQLAGIDSRKSFFNLADRYYNENNAIIVFSEKEVSSNAAMEIMNLSILTGKPGKTSPGIISLKEKNNSQGLFDMGLFDNMLPGGIDRGDTLPYPAGSDHLELLESGAFKNMFIFGEDPLGCAEDREKVAGWLKKARFVVVQDYFMTETASVADLILPASLPFESGGSYTSTSRVIQQFDKQSEPLVELTGYEQLLALLKARGIENTGSLEDVRLEIFSVLGMARKNRRLSFTLTRSGDKGRLFRHGCDSLVKRFDEEFLLAFKNKEMPGD